MSSHLTQPKTYFIIKRHYFLPNISFISNRIANKPVGSTSFASLIASDVAMSWLAGDIANMIQLGWEQIEVTNLELEDAS